MIAPLCKEYDSIRPSSRAPVHYIEARKMDDLCTSEGARIASRLEDFNAIKNHRILGIESQLWDLKYEASRSQLGLIQISTGIEDKCTLV